jgi:hypothetical protein
MQLRTGRAPISFNGFVTRSVMPMLLGRMAAGQRLRRVRVPQVGRTNDRKLHVNTLAQLTLGSTYISDIPDPVAQLYFSQRTDVCGMWIGILQLG